jgi:hypothetical protein
MTFLEKSQCSVFIKSIKTTNQIIYTIYVVTIDISQFGLIV